MSDFAAAMAPVVFLWSVPVLPLVYTALVTLAETVLDAGRSRSGVALAPTPSPSQELST